MPADVADSNAMAAHVKAATDATGRLDLLVNDAGLIDPIARIMDSDPAARGRIIDVNVKGFHHGLCRAMPVMAAKGGGTIVNIASGAANSSLEGRSHYCVSKAAVLRLTGVAHKAAHGKGVRVVGLSPGTVATEMQQPIRASGINPVREILRENHVSPEWVAKAVAFPTTPGADKRLGSDVSLKFDEGCKSVGMMA